MNEDKKRKTIEARQARDKESLLVLLRKMPILQVACEQTDIGRSTVYRWRESDEPFRKAMDEAITEGEAYLTDISESQLVTLIRDKHFGAIKLYLQHHHSKYANKIELLSRLTVEDEPLTPEQEALVRKALNLASFNPDESSHEETNEP